MSTERLEVGEILIKELLGTKAYYRVVEERGGTILIEVLHAPGLARGFRLSVTSAAAVGMRTTGNPEVADVSDGGRGLSLGRLRPNLVKILSAVGRRE